MFFELILLVLLLLMFYSNAQSPAANGNLNLEQIPPEGNIRQPLALPLMSEEDKNRFINRALVDNVMTKVLKVVINQLFSKKDPDFSYKNFLISKGANKTKLKRNYKFLVKTDCDDLDVTALTAILRAGIETLISDVSTKSESTKSITNVQRVRNEIMHQPKAAAVASESRYKIEEALETLLDAAGVAAGMNETEVKQMKDRIPKDIEHYVTSTAAQNKLIHTTCKFRVSGKLESQRYWKQYCQKGISIDHEQVQLKEVFYPLNLKGVDEYGNENINSFEVCIKTPSERKVTIVEAEAGAGKTTVMKYIGLAFYGLIDENQIEALGSYDLLHFFECGDTTSSSLRQYIQNTYPETCQDLEIDEVVRSLGIMNNIFIIDGFDELNENSNKVINELITLMKRWKTNTFIFTMRSYAISSFIKMLHKENIDFNHFQIEGLCDKNEQIAFLERLDSQNKTPDMIDSFRKLDPHLTDFFRFPVNLTYYRSLFRTSPETIKQWRVDSDVLDDMYQLFTVLIENKVPRRLTDHVKLFLEEVNDLALRYLLIDRVVIEKNDFDQLKTDCMKKIRENLPYDQMLSNIFITKTSPHPISEAKLQFQHKSVQEYFASKALVKKLLAEDCQEPINVLIDMETEEREKKSRLLSATLAQHPPLKNEYQSLKSKKQFGRFEKLFAFAINELRKQGAPTKTLIQNIVKLLPADKDIAVASFRYWDRLLRLCKYDKTLLEIVSQEVTWDAVNTSTLSDSEKPPSLLFNTLDEQFYVQEVLIVVPRNITEYRNIKLLLQKLVELRYGGWLRFILENSYENLIPCDDIAMDFHGSKCRLIEFRGCLSEGKTLKILSKVQIEMALMAIGVPAKHSLDFLPLAGTSVQLYVQVLFSKEADQNQLKLPKTNEPVHVRITGLPERSWQDAAQMIISMAPENKTFSSIEIVNSTMEDEEVNSLVLELEANGLSVDLDLKEMKWDKVKKVGQVLPCIRMYPTLPGV